MALTTCRRHDGDFEATTAPAHEAGDGRVRCPTCNSAASDFNKQKNIDNNAADTNPVTNALHPRITS
jgi:hypothetical protein